MTRWLNDLLSAVAIVGTMLIAAAMVAAVGFAAEAETWSWYEWLLISPLLYLAWLLVFLLICAWSCRQIGIRHPKPRHAVIHPGLQRPPGETLGMATAAMCYRRLAILQSTPFVSLLARFRHLDTLVLRAYSPSVHIGANVVNWGGLYDPDLTVIGDDVVLGGQSTVTAHGMVARGDGALVYVSAPVKIGDRATIGSEARVTLGCVIGHDAIVETGAVVEPFTQIPPGEVWGGNPAGFRRRRENIDESPEEPPADKVAVANDQAATLANDDVRRVVVEALGVERDEVPDDLSMRTCPLWDSLGQVAVAAAIFDRYGITVDGRDVFQLRSVDDIVNFIERHRAHAAEGPPVGGAVPLPDDLALLPLLDAQTATQALAAAKDLTPAGTTRLHVTIAASFTAQAIEPPLNLWARAFGFDLACEFADYNQIVQTLLAQTGSLSATGDGVTVVLARPEDLPSDPSAATTALDEILDAIERAASDRPPGNRLLVGTLPPVVSSFAAIDELQVDELRHRWRTRLTAIESVELLDFSRVVERLGTASVRSSQLEALTRGGYSQRLHQELAIALVRRIRSAYGRTAKVVALDCDNTLWGGIVGEVGLEGLELAPDGPGRSFQLIQQHLKRLKDRGVLLAVVSRNEERDVREVFARHPEMILGSDDIAAWRVNWDHKSDNLRQLAEELNLGLDSFVFLDDDPMTRMEVKTRTPEVHVVPLPDDPADFCETLDRLWLFDGAQGTSVDATRTQKARDEERRRRDRDEAGSLDDFLARLDLEVDLSRASDDDWSRVAQLTQRTNQFNLSLKRRTLEEVKALPASSTVLVLAARDRFGDYGQVGVCVLEPGAQQRTCELDTFLMSCRALGRGVEDAFLHGIAAAAAGQGASTLVARFRSGPRNGQVKDFLARSGFDETEPDLWTLSLDWLPPLPKHVRFGGLQGTNGSAPVRAPEPPGRSLPPRSQRISLPFVVFDEADVSLFSEASHDRNPLHLDPRYARRTPHGQPVLFGMLGALAALGHLEKRPNRALRAVTIEFRQPLFPGVRYRVETQSASSDHHQLMIWDAGRLATKMSVAEGSSRPEPVERPPFEENARQEAIDRALDELTPGTLARGTYAPAARAFDRLLDRFALEAKGFGRDELAALLWASYLVGMELPGRRALFWSLDLRFQSDDPGSEVFAYEAAVKRADAQLELVEVAAGLLCAGKRRAEATIRAFVRREASSLPARTGLATGEPSDVLRGKVAVVIGGSRGLGATMVQAFAMKGCSVIATYSASADDAEHVARSVEHATGAVQFIQGDAGDEAWCREVLEPTVSDKARLDFLVCNAAPPIRPLRLDADALERFQDFTSTSLALVAAPLAMLLEPLSESSGTCVFVSSSFVRTQPAEWPHYITAKSAAEGLIEWASATYPQVRFVVARPPRMLTDQTNTPEGRQGAMPPEHVAEAIVRRLSNPTGERVELLETFED